MSPGPLTYGDDYQNGKSGDTSQAGLIDEVGAADGLNRLGPDELLLFAVPVEPMRQGALTFTPSPADLLPQHYVLLYDLDDPVSSDQVEYAPLTIQVGAGGVSLIQTNPRNAMDVNDDFSVSPFDALLVINELNVDASSPAARAANASRVYLDVSADGVLSPLDALLIINQLNRGSAVAAQAPLSAIAAALPSDAEAEALDTAEEVALLPPASPAGSPVTLTADGLTDSLFADREASSLADSSAGDALDEILTALGDEITQLRN